jgi:hypothetical protein
MLANDISIMKTLVCSILLIAEMLSCNHSQKVKAPVKQFIEKLGVVSPGYEYNLVSDDEEHLYKTVDSDSLFFPRFVSIVGYLSDTSKYYNILYLDAGDDLYPAVKVLSKSGKQMDFKIVSYAECASGGCEIDSCVSKIKLIDDETILSSLTMVTSQCDSLGRKIVGGSHSVVMKERKIKVGSSGTIEFGDERLNEN